MNYENAVSWFEIPAVDLERAAKFYEHIMAIQLIPMDMPGMRMRMFPVPDMMNNISGAIVESDGFHKPTTTDGVLLYLNGNPDVQMVLDKVEAAGGKVVLGKTEISPEHGFMGIITDTEGNRIAFHSVPV